MLVARNLQPACLRRWGDRVLSLRKDWGHIKGLHRRDLAFLHQGYWKPAPTKFIEKKANFAIYSFEMVGAAVQTVTCSEREFHVPWPRVTNLFSIRINISLSQMQLMTEGTTAIETISMKKTYFLKRTQKYSVTAAIL